MGILYFYPVFIGIQTFHTEKIYGCFQNIVKSSSGRKNPGEKRKRKGGSPFT